MTERQYELALLAIKFWQVAARSRDSLHVFAKEIAIKVLQEILDDLRKELQEND